MKCSAFVTSEQVNKLLLLLILLRTRIFDETTLIVINGRQYRINFTLDFLLGKITVLIPLLQHLHVSCN